MLKMKRMVATVLISALTIPFLCKPTCVEAVSMENGKVVVKEDDLSDSNLTQDKIDMIIERLYEAVESGEDIISFTAEDELMLADYNSVFQVYDTVVTCDGKFSGLNCRFLQRDRFYGWYYTDQIESLQLFYVETGNDRMEDFGNAQEKLAEIMAGAPKGCSDRVKAQYYHDYIAENYVYDVEGLANMFTEEGAIAYSGNGPLLYGKGVCEGLAIVYNYLLNAEGIESYVVRTDTDTLDHAWNVVKINGRWLYVDTTWDLGVDESGYAKQNNFLMTEAEFRANGHGDGVWMLPTGKTVDALVDEVVLGDANGDNEVSFLDVVQLYRYLINECALVPKCIANADMDNDGEIDIFDLALLKRTLIQNESNENGVAD